MPFDTMKKLDEIEMSWLAGLLEGEGSFVCGPPSKSNQPMISIEMTDKDIIYKVANIFETNPGCYRRKGYKVSYYARLRGLPAVKLMKILKPMMGVRRCMQIDKAIKSYKDNSNKTPRDIVLKIKEMLASNISMKCIAIESGVSYSTVKAIKYGWRHIDVSRRS